MSEPMESGQANQSGSEEKLSVALREARRRLQPKASDQRKFTVPSGMVLDLETAKLVAGVAFIVSDGNIDDPANVLKEVLVSLIKTAVTGSDKKEIAKIPDGKLDEVLVKIFRVK